MDGTSKVQKEGIQFEVGCLENSVHTVQSRDEGCEKLIGSHAWFLKFEYYGASSFCFVAISHRDVSPRIGI